MPICKTVDKKNRLVENDYESVRNHCQNHKTGQPASPHFTNRGKTVIVLGLCQNEPISQRSVHAHANTDFLSAWPTGLAATCLSADASKVAPNFPLKMISVAHRFHGYGSLKGVYKRGRTVRSSSINLKFDYRGSRKPYRSAVVVSKKVSKSAVVRNRIRRRIYETVRRAENDIAPGSDLVFTVFDERVAKMDAPKLQATVLELLKKAAAQLDQGQKHL